MRVGSIVFLVLVTFSACKNAGHEDERELRIMRELVLLRTEGLALADFVQTKAQDPKVIAMCEELHSYYEETHPEFLQICAGRQISVSDQDFDLLWNKMSERFSIGNTSVEQTCLQLCEENICSSIRLYEEIIQKRDWEDMAYFSFIALPDLYNQQQDLEQLKVLIAGRNVQTSL